MFSSRLPPTAETNAITRALDALRAEGIPIVDLTASNPTTAGIPYPPDILDGLGGPRALTYEPQPFGLREAREAVAGDCARRGAHVDAGDVVLTASTSESYGWLFKLLCDPGDLVAVPQPSYPLFEHLTRLEGVGTWTYGLEYHGRWEVDVARLEAAPARTRAVLVVSPNNPTGSYISSRDLEAVTRICAERGWALIVDEVFADYPLDEPAPLTDIAVRADVLAFTLGGASKALGLPQVKLGWTILGGPARIRAAARDALELIADTYLSVGTPVQVAAGSLMARGAAVRTAIHDRVRANLDHARRIVARHPACGLLRVDGGWSAPIRVPATRSEDAMVLSLLAQERILVHPGFFFDFPHDAFIVVSLLPEEAAFADALERALRFLQV